MSIALDGPREKLLDLGKKYSNLEWIISDSKLKRAIDDEVYKASQDFCLSYEVTYFEELMAKQPLQVMPLPKKRTAIDFELNQSFWRLEKIMLAIKKICEEHEGKRDLHIKFTGGLNELEI